MLESISTALTTTFEVIVIGQWENRIQVRQWIDGALSTAMQVQLFDPDTGCP